MKQENIAREKLRQKNEDPYPGDYFTSDEEARGAGSPAATTPSEVPAEIDNTPSTPSRSLTTPIPSDTDADSAAPTMRLLEVNRAGMRTNPTPDNPVDTCRIPSDLEVNMNDRGRATIAVSHADPTELA